MFALCASSSLCPIQSFVCVTFFKNVQLPHQGYCVATHQYIYVYNNIRIHRLYINTQCCESNMCICVWVYGKYLYFACQSLRKKRLLIELEIDFALSTKRVICDFRVVIFMTVASFEFFSTLNAHGYAQIRCSSHHLVSMGAVQVIGYTHLWVYIYFMDHEPKMFDRFRPNIRWICMRQVI